MLSCSARSSRAPTSRMPSSAVPTSRGRSWTPPTWRARTPTRTGAPPPPVDGSPICVTVGPALDVLIQQVADELRLRPEQVDRTLALSADGATVPFVARYRKEATGGLDEVQIQAILDSARRRRELTERRMAVISSIEQQGRMTPELARALAAAATRTELEDLYLPYRPRRRTRATIARERGLE